MSVVNEKGATMAEFAIAAVFIMGLLAVAFDFGVGLFQYNLLTHVTTDTARKYATTLNDSLSGEDCVDLNKDVEDSAENTIEKKMKIGGEYSFDSEIKFDAVSPPTLRLKGTLHLSCIVCAVISRTLNISTTSEVLIEYRDFVCS